MIHTNLPAPVSMLNQMDQLGHQVADILETKLHTPPPIDYQETWRQEVQALVDRLPPQHLTHHLLRRLERHKFRVRTALSFHRRMVEDSETRKLGMKSLGWKLDNKTVAYRFIDALGVRRPQATEPTEVEEVEWKYPGVLKALGSTGSRGCYLLFAKDHIVHVRDGKTFSSREAVLKHAQRLMNPKAGRGIRNRWFTEELILEDQNDRIPARDMKFFCFYGEPILHLEVIRSNGQSKYSFRTEDGTPVRPGSWDYHYFEGQGPTSDMFQLVSTISQEIPHPFMRIDMLNGEEGLVFGEFTPRPGVFQKFDHEWDRRMGEEWARAEARIKRDLLSGKRFDAFLSATDRHKPIRQHVTQTNAP